MGIPNLLFVAVQKLCAILIHVVAVVVVIAMGRICLII